MWRRCTIPGYKYEYVLEFGSQKPPQPGFRWCIDVIYTFEVHLWMVLRENDITIRRDTLIEPVWDVDPKDPIPNMLCFRYAFIISDNFQPPPLPKKALDDMPHTGSLRASRFVSGYFRQVLEGLAAIHCALDIARPPG